MRSSKLILVVAITFSGLVAQAAPQNVAIILYDGVEVLDFAGPAEVLEIASHYGKAKGVPAFNLFTVAPDAEAVISQNFLRVIPDHTTATAPAPDILIIPGGRMGTLLRDEGFMKWADVVMEDAVTLTVCSGASLPAKLGRLDGIRTTTWHGLVDRMDERFPGTDFQHGLRFVDTGPIITTAGVSAGIDGALHLVARLLGLEVARDTARYMEYAWSPEPYLVDTYPILNPALGPAEQTAKIAEIQRNSGDLEGAEATYRRALDSTDEESLWHGLYLTLSEMKRWRPAVDASLRVAETNPVRGYYNAACASAQLGDHDHALEYLKKAVDAGFHNRTWIENDDDLAPLRNDPRFRTMLELIQQER